MTHKEALTLALEALEYIENNYMSLPAPATKAIAAIKEALNSPDGEAQPEQRNDSEHLEPVATLGMYEHKCPNVTGHRGPSFVCQKAGHGVGQNSYCKNCTCPEALNTSPLPAQQQEPAFWYSAQEDEFMTHKIRKEHERLNSYTHKFGKFDLALYTTPPQRKPLTDEQLKPLIQKAMMYYGHNPDHWLVTSGAGFCILARAIEAAHGIKEKNTHEHK